MTQYFKPRMDILAVAQQRLWPELHPSIGSAWFSTAAPAPPSRSDSNIAPLSISISLPQSRLTRPCCNPLSHRRGGALWLRKRLDG